MMDVLVGKEPGLELTKLTYVFGKMRKYNRRHDGTNMLFTETGKIDLSAKNMVRDCMTYGL